jgi:hypothetical protein
MEFASEMVVKSKLAGLKLCEVPTTLKPDGRDRPPHLNTWSDGLRHLRFLLCFSPRWLFLYPGLFCVLLGLAMAALVMPGPLRVGAVVFDIHTLVYAGGLILVGAQGVFFAVLSKVYALTHGLLPPRSADAASVRFFERISLGQGVVMGIVAVVMGVVGSVAAVYGWVDRGLGNYDPGVAMRIVVPSVVLLALGAQTIFSSFFLSLMTMPKRDPR